MELPPGLRLNFEDGLGAEGFPELAHDDEVDACSGALEMLTPQMAGWGILELARQELEAAKQHSQPGRSLIFDGKGAVGACKVLRGVGFFLLW
jgi:hypothetical protein